MLIRAVAPFTLACAALLAPMATRAAEATSPAPPSEVRAWLLRIHEAASRRNFAGTFVVTGGGNVASARITHFCEGPNQFERIESLDGRKRQVFRHNDVVHTLWPASRVAMVEQRGMFGSFPGLLRAGDDGIANWYHVLPEGTDRIAGHEVDVLAVRARDAYRYGYRFWADRASGLLLRLDVIGERGEVLETSAFSDVVIGVRPQPEGVMHAMKKLGGYRVVRPTLVPTRLELQGWEMRQSAPGFRQVSCVSRHMEASAEAAVASTAAAAAVEPPVIQAIYSDGLTYVSVFIEPYRAERHGQPMVAVSGATTTMTRRLGDWWLTVVGDTPPTTLKLFANGLERKKP